MDSNYKMLRGRDRKGRRMASGKVVVVVDESGYEILEKQRVELIKHINLHLSVRKMYLSNIYNGNVSSVLTR